MAAADHHPKTSSPIRLVAYPAVVCQLQHGVQDHHHLKPTPPSGATAARSSWLMLCSFEHSSKAESVKFFPKSSSPTFKIWCQIGGFGGQIYWQGGGGKWESRPPETCQNLKPFQTTCHLLICALWVGQAWHPGRWLSARQDQDCKYFGKVIVILCTFATV